MKFSLCLLVVVAVSFGHASPVQHDQDQALKPLGPLFRAKLLDSDPLRAKRAARNNGLSEQDQQTILATHNGHRGDVSPSAANMVPLRWDAELAASAQAWADQCTFSHDDSSDRRTDEWWWVGQNIAYGFGYSMTSYIDSWNDEKVDYDYASNTCASGAVCGHYTQVVWADSTFIGCGWATCPYNYKGVTYPFDYLVCNYGPGGNFNGNKPYISGSPCSSCPRGYGGGCDSNLCTCEC
ncbi:peptidase inhibitor R3HDML-like [Diadema antillarum]|uniref:peptidase inhibitor R3HDML-like n=1 Tax=Diadema antillarum TaxID=105358 RepID=UPI003A84B1BF